ncbi:MAG: OB-fold protein [Chitinophagales bacterium]
MKKKLGILIILGLIVGSVIAYTQYNKPHRNIAEEKAYVNISANNLFDVFNENETFANLEYLDKVIKVIGDISEISQDKENKQVVTLEAENAMFGGVICTLSESNEDIIIGDQVALKCRCTGFLDDVILVDCTLEK